MALNNEPETDDTGKKVHHYRIERGAKVIGTNGELGTVEQIVVERDSGVLRSIIVKSLDGKKWNEYKAAHIRRADGNRVDIDFGSVDIEENSEMIDPYEPALFVPLKGGTALHGKEAEHIADLKEGMVVTNLDEDAAEVVAVEQPRVPKEEHEPSKINDHPSGLEKPGSKKPLMEQVDARTATDLPPGDSTQPFPKTSLREPRMERPRVVRTEEVVAEVPSPTAPREAITQTVTPPPTRATPATAPLPAGEQEFVSPDDVTIREIDHTDGTISQLSDEDTVILPVAGKPQEPSTPPANEQRKVGADLLAAEAPDTPPEHQLPPGDPADVTVNAAPPPPAPRPPVSAPPPAARAESPRTIPPNPVPPEPRVQRVPPSDTSRTRPPQGLPAVLTAGWLLPVAGAVALAGLTGIVLLMRWSGARAERKTLRRARKSLDKAAWSAGSLMELRESLLAHGLIEPRLTGRRARVEDSLLDRLTDRAGAGTDERGIAVRHDGASDHVAEKEMVTETRAIDDLGHQRPIFSSRRVAPDR